MPHKGVLVKDLLLTGEQIAGILYRAGFHDAEVLVQAVATALAECNGYAHSYNDNFDVLGGPVVQRDVGLMQIGIRGRDIGSSIEKALLDPAKNAERAFAMYQDRGWKPWSSFNTGIVFDDTYQARACLGVFNYLAWTAGKAQAKITDPLRTPHHIIQQTTVPHSSNGHAAPLITLQEFRTHYPGIPL